MHRPSLVIVLALVSAACKSDPPPASAPTPPASGTRTGSSAPGAGSDLGTAKVTVKESAAVAMARAAATDLKVGLKQALTAALKDRGPAGAIEVCATEAPRLAAAASSDAIRIGRATTRTRNPANLATGWQAEAIAVFEATAIDQRASAVFTRVRDDGTTLYAEPLIAAGVCLICHGAAVSSDITAALATRYPDDRATGYADRDLRGVVWAEVQPAAR